MFFNEAIKPRISELNENGRLSYEAILSILETVGSHHSDCANDNVVAGSNLGIAWLLVDWRVSILRHPTYDDTLKLTTWVRGKANAVSVYRDFAVNDDNGQEMLRAEAKFCLVDIKTGMIKIRK